MHLPLENLGEPPPELLARLQEKPNIVLYCNGSGCGSVYAAAKRLSDYGIKNLFVYSEGWPEWKAARQPMTMSEAMKKDIEEEWNPQQIPEEEL